MNQDQLQGPLQDLYDQLTRTRSSDPRVQERIDALAGEIKRALDEPRELRPEAQQDFLSRMRGSVEYFEGTHPELTAVLNNVISSLANAGI